MSTAKPMPSGRPRGARPDDEAIGRMLASRRCCALTRSGGLCRAPSVKDKLRCRKHGGAAGSGAPKGNRNARKHGLYAAAERAERRRIMDLVRECNWVLDEIDKIYGKK
jgi:glucans biosynthesis protein